jgi:hypothetical protein
MLEPSTATIPVNIIKDVISCEYLVEKANVLVAMIVDIVPGYAFANKIVFEFRAEWFKILVPPVTKTERCVF